MYYHRGHPSANIEIFHSESRFLHNLTTSLQKHPVLKFLCAQAWSLASLDLHLYDLLHLNVSVISFQLKMRDQNQLSNLQISLPEARPQAALHHHPALLPPPAQLAP